MDITPHCLTILKIIETAINEDTKLTGKLTKMTDRIHTILGPIIILLSESELCFL